MTLSIAGVTYLNVVSPQIIIIFLSQCYFRTCAIYSPYLWPFFKIDVISIHVRFILYIHRCGWYNFMFCNILHVR